jgi:hypothetical protein
MVALLSIALTVDSQGLEAVHRTGEAHIALNSNVRSWNFAVLRGGGRLAVKKLYSRDRGKVPRMSLLGRLPTFAGVGIGIGKYPYPNVRSRPKAEVAGPGVKVSGFFTLIQNSGLERTSGPDPQLPSPLRN